MYLHYKSMVDNDMPGAWPVWTPGSPLAGFIKRSNIHCFTQNMKALVSEKKKKMFLMFFFPLSMGAIAPLGWGHFLPQGHDLQDLCKASNNNAAYQKYKLLLL